MTTLYRPNPSGSMSAAPRRPDVLNTHEHAPAANYLVAIRPLAFFRPSEHIDLDHVERLVASIGADQVWTTPIPVVGGHGIVMDGNHRVHAARLLGLKYLPCVPLDYGDPRVTVRHWIDDAPFCVDTIFRTVLDNQIFPYKTTRHLFDPVLPQTDIALGLLGG